MTAYFDDLTVTETAADMSGVPWDAKADKGVETRAYSNQDFLQIRDRFKAAVAAKNQGWISAELERGNRQLGRSSSTPTVVRSSVVPITTWSPCAAP